MAGSQSPCPPMLPTCAHRWVDHSPGQVVPGTASPWIGRLSLGQRRPVFCIAVSMLQAALLCRVSPICARSGQGKCAQPHPAPVVVSATCASASSPSRQGRRGAYEEGPVVRGAPAASPLVLGAGSADPLWYETILVASLCTLSPSSADLSRLYFGLRPSATQPSCVSGPSVSILRIFTSLFSQLGSSGCASGLARVPSKSNGRRDIRSTARDRPKTPRPDSSSSSREPTSDSAD